MAKKAKRRPKFKTKKRAKLKPKKNKNKKNKLRAKLSALAQQRKLEELSSATATETKSSFVQSPQTESTVAQSSKSSSKDTSEQTSTLFNYKPLTTTSNCKINQEKKKAAPLQQAKQTDIKKLETHQKRALAILHNHLVGTEVRFQRDVYELEKIYINKYYKPLLACRKMLICGVQGGSPLDLEHVESCCSVFEANDEDFKRLKMHLQFIIDTGETMEFSENFWLTAMMNSDPILQKLIHWSDIPKLQYLTDISSDHVEVAPGEFRKDNAVGFELKFQFRANPFFTNPVISKRYVIDLTPDDEDYVITDEAATSQIKLSINRKEDCDADGEESEHDFHSTMGSVRNKRLRKVESLLDYKGPQVVAIKSTNIDWYKPPCNHSDSDAASGSSMSQPKSFFNFFKSNWNESSPGVSATHIQQDYRVGAYIRDVLIPRAYFIYRRKVNLAHDSDSAVESVSKEPTVSNSRTQAQTVVGQIPSKVSNQPINTYQHDDDFSLPLPDDILEEYDGIDADPPSGTSFKPTSIPDSPTEPTVKTISKQEIIKEYDKIDDDIKLPAANRTSEAASLGSQKAPLNTKISEALSIGSQINQRQSILDATNKTPGSMVNNYDDVDEAVPAQHRVSALGGMDIDIDDELPAKIPRMDSAQFERSQPSLQEAPPTFNGTFESVSSSRRRMEGLVDRVNSIIRRQEAGLPVRYEDSEPTENTCDVANELAHLRDVIEMEQGSEIASSDHVYSKFGEVADDEEEWTEYNHSVNRAFERIRSNLKRGIPVEPSQTASIDISSFPSTKDSDSNSHKVVFRDVSPYPSDGEVDGSDVLSTAVETSEPVTDAFVNVTSPSSSEMDTECEALKMPDIGLTQPISSAAPKCSTGVRNRDQQQDDSDVIIDHDSEAPATPPLDEPSPCVQQ
uniref:Uncharacterized LOC100183814 n=1 Tax=Ciona intestinalis TaxID=7719 RepID=F6VBY8_CIOIN|nr:uncharacterized protein LOC100183814 [Ciona intestinalis]|eukprot:XP_002130185.2 uncharacterized protein LOC100183814 [Ciona intestinalis]